jgi:hypothetical protein
VRDDDDDWEDYEDDLYEYDWDRMFFKRYQPVLDPLLVVRKSSVNPKHPFADGSLSGTETAATLPSGAMIHPR